MSILITASTMVTLAAAVTAASGEIPRLMGYHGRRSRHHRASLAYLGPNPAIVVYELAVILAGQACRGAADAGYTYGADDIVEELRHLICQIDSPSTDILGREILFYWPNVQVAGPPP